MILINVGKNNLKNMFYKNKKTLNLDVKHKIKMAILTRKQFQYNVGVYVGVYMLCVHVHEGCVCWGLG